MPFKRLPYSFWQTFVGFFFLTSSVSSTEMAGEVQVNLEHGPTVVSNKRRSCELRKKFYVGLSGSTANNAKG